MGEEVFIVAIVFGSITAIVFLGIMSSLVHTWVKNRGNKSIKEDDEFLDALREFKTKTDRRLTALESGLAQKKPDRVTESTQSDKSIRIDSRPEKTTSAKEGNLKNILKE
ncbi:MAG: hypothetical protein WD355_09045 [Balneolaceae bacterium]